MKRYEWMKHFIKNSTNTKKESIFQEVAAIITETVEKYEESLITICFRSKGAVASVQL